MNKENKILKTLYANADAVYRDFNSALIPSISKDFFIGVRTPVLRKLAKEMVKSGKYKDFITDLPHKYFEENQLHAFILSLISDFDVVMYETERFLPYIDNWATCDQMSPSAFKKNKNVLLRYICKWVTSKDTYTVRFAIKCLMQYWLDEDFDEKYADIVTNIKSDDYYINMMRAWYFATGLAKQYNRVLPYFEKGRLDEWTRVRAIQKALESFRVSAEHKKELRLLK